MNFGGWWCVVAVAGCVAGCVADKWRWPEPAGAAAVRIDTKVRFLDHDNNEQHVQADESVFEAAAQTDGFYNRPGGAGRYPVRVETPRQSGKHALYSHISKNYESDGTLDSLEYCKCVSNPDCSPRQVSGRACGAGKFLCCYKGPQGPNRQNTEYFNEIEDERLTRLPSKDRAHPFPAPPEFEHRGVLVGPGGPTGSVGPTQDGGQAVLVGPEGPTGHIGPGAQVGNNRNGGNTPAVLVGSGGPTGIVGPQGHGPQGHGNIAELPNRNPAVLVGPGGPTNVIGPAHLNGPRDVSQSETAQRGILVGPGGPTGFIGPRGFGQQRPVLVGPGGPTGIIGPRMQGFFNEYLGRQRRPGLLVGPGGPTGIIGPGRQLLVGPGGPTGQIGPQSYFA